MAPGPSLSVRFHGICRIVDATQSAEVLCLNDKAKLMTISTALLFSIDFIMRNVLMAVSIILVEMAVKCLLVLVVFWFLGWFFFVKHGGQR